MDKLCPDVFLGYDILKRHESLHINFRGQEAPLKVFSVVTAALFEMPPSDRKPIFG